MPIIERTINSARNPKWANYHKTSIVIEVDFDELDEEYVEFNAHPDDIVSWSVELYNRSIAGEFGPIGEFEPPPGITGEEAMERLRKYRDSLLTNNVDPIVTNPLRWNDLTEEKQQEWKDYRQALLDLPANNPSAYLGYNVETERPDWMDLTLPTKPE